MSKIILNNKMTGSHPKIYNVFKRAISVNRQYTFNNFRKEFGEDFKQVAKAQEFDHEVNSFLIDREISQDVIKTLESQFSMFLAEDKKNEELIRYAYIHLFLLYLFNQEIREGKINVGSRISSENYELIPDYTFYYKGALLSEKPDHVMYRNLDDKFILLVGDNTGDKSFIRTGIQNSFYLSSYADENFLRTYYGMITDFKRFQFIKYVKNLNKISLSRIYLPFHESRDMSPKLNLEEIRKIALITKILAEKNESYLL